MNALKLILRLIGTSSALGAIFVAVPYEWMNSIHADLGLGTLPDAPIVGYLARSTSAMYAILGGLFWVLSFDLTRYRNVLIYFGCIFPLFGLALLAVDILEGLPMFWVLWEGPFIVIRGTTIHLLARRIPATSEKSPG